MHPLSTGAVLGLAIAFSAAVAATPSASRAEESPAPRFAPDRIGLRLRADVARAAYADFAAARDRRAATPLALASLRSRLAGARLAPEFPGETSDRTDLAAFWIARIDPRLGLESALAAARAAPEVEEAFPIALVPVEPLVAAEPWAGGAPGPTAVPAPDDSLWSLCWWLHQPSRRDLHALEAWAITRGDATSVIAIIDTGVLLWHPELGGTTAGDDGQLWANAIERAGAPGVDDDGNGYADDLHGWDFVDLESDELIRAGEDWRDEDGDPSDFAVHGTAVAGVAAARANNRSGIAGVAPGAKIMALRAGWSATYNPAGVMDMSMVARAILYARRHGATVINCSFATSGQPDLAAAIADAIASGVVIVFAAGNNGSAHYLGGYEEPIAVTATDAADRIPTFANRGNWVDVAAPGQSIPTTTLRATGEDSLARRTPFYSSGEAGTSFSAPMVAAGVAMMQADRRARGLLPLPPLLALLRVMETADDIAALNPAGGYGGGRLNLERLLTDPERSTGFPSEPTIGACAILPPAHAPVIVYAYADHLRWVDARTRMGIASAALDAPPVGSVAAAPLGGGLGWGVFVALADGRVAGFDETGRVLPGWPVSAPRAASEDAMPALADLDGDGILEIVRGSDDGTLRAWRVNGTLVPGFPWSAGTPGPVRFAIADFDGCPGADLVVATPEGRLFALTHPARVIPGWPVAAGSTAAPVVARLTADGTPVVVVGAGRRLQSFLPNGHPFFESFVPFGDLAGELAAGDLDGDGFDEIIGLTVEEPYLFVADRLGGITASRRFGTRFGPPILGSLTPGAGASILITLSDFAGLSRLVAYDRSLLPLIGWPKPGRNARAATLADVDGDGTTEVLAGAGSDGFNLLYDAGPGTWRAGEAGWPTPRGNFARTGSRIPATLTGDGLPPPAIADLAADSIEVRAATVRWSAPAGARSYDVRIATFRLEDSNFESGVRLFESLVPKRAGTAEVLTIGGLLEARRYWVAVRSHSGCGPWSALSNLAEFTTQAVAPAAVADLRVVVAGNSAATLTWTASGEDGRSGRPALYRFRASPEPLDSAGFEVAPWGRDVQAAVAAGYPEHATLAGLPANQDLHVALRAIDAAGNASAISNVVELRLGGAPLPEELPSSLAVRSPAHVPVEVRWRADASAGAFRDIAIYDASGRQVFGERWIGGTAGVTRWNGENEGSLAPAGVYFVRFTSGDVVTHRRFVLLR